MKLSFKALKNFVDFTGTPEECAAILADLGFPNDGMTHIGSGIQGVVLGQILEMKAHPEADRLSLLQVNVGEASPVPIVCGAKNMKVGDYVALARVGARIPGSDGQGMELKKAKLRGQVSEGMCCSEVELGLGTESDGIWLISPSDLEREASSQLGKDIVSLMDLEDAIFEIDITPNRGDALSVRGIARELAAKLGLKLRVPKLYRWKQPSSATQPSIESFEDAYGFAACYVKNLKPGRTPWEWQQFLKAHGSRSLGAAIDVTNIVLFELGHPIHFFDADRVDPQSIQIRKARAGEKLLLLNGQTIDLHPEDLVVADAHRPLSLAGVMGGAESAVSDKTENILIEVASFNPSLIRATAQRHQLHSESSFRFERGVTPFRIDETMERALSLLQDFCGFESAAGNKTIHRNLQRPSCLWSRQKVEAKLGKLNLSDNEIFDQLRRLEYELEPRSAVPQLVFPWYRTDASILEDVMEDIARLVGYENLERKRLSSEESEPVLQDLSEVQRVGNELVDRFVSKGFVEAIHWSFSNSGLEEGLVPEGIRSQQVLNPIHAEKPQLRRMLLPQLLERARWNAAHGEEEIRIFEMGPVFSWQEFSNYQNSPSSELWHLGCVWFPKAQDKKRLWKSSTDDFFEFRGALESIFSRFELSPSLRVGDVLQRSVFHPRRHFEIAGAVAGEIHPIIADRFDLKGRVFAAEFRLHPLLPKQITYESSSHFPAIDFDVSFSVDRNLPMKDLLQAFAEKKSELLEWVRPYDIYEGGDDASRRAITFFVRYRSSERTLELDEAKKEHETLIQSVIKTFPSGKLALR